MSALMRGRWARGPFWFHVEFSFPSPCAHPASQQQTGWRARLIPSSVLFPINQWNTLVFLYFLKEFSNLHKNHPRCLWNMRDAQAPPRTLRWGRSGVRPRYAHFEQTSQVILTKTAHRADLKKHHLSLSLQSALSPLLTCPLLESDSSPAPL